MHPTDQHDDGVGPPPHLVRIGSLEHLVDPVVVLVDRPEHQDDQRDHDDGDPRAGGELRHDDHDQHDPGGDAPDHVDDQPSLPVRFPQREVVTAHPELRQREPGEHAHRVQRDEQRDLGPERDDQDGREAGQQQDAVREHEAVAAVGQLTGQVPVAGDDRRQPGEVGVGRVGREHEDGERGDLERVVERVVGAEHRLGHLRQDGLAVFLHHRQEMVGEHRDAHEPRTEDERHEPERPGRVLRLRPLERGDAVRDGLDARQDDRPRGEGLEEGEEGDAVRQLLAVGELLGGLRTARDRTEVERRTPAPARRSSIENSRTT